MAYSSAKMLVNPPLAKAVGIGHLGRLQTAHFAVTVTGARNLVSTAEVFLGRSPDHGRTGGLVCFLFLRAVLRIG